MSLLPGLAALLLFVAMEAFFSGSEMALINADRLRLKTKADQGDRGARMALDLLENEDQLLGTCLIGTNLAVVSGSTLAAMLLLSHGVTGQWTPTLLFTPAVLIFGEALPKTVMQHHADRLSPLLAYPLTAASRVFWFALLVVDLGNRALGAIVGAELKPFLTRKELVALLDDRAQSPIRPQERRLIMGVLNLTDSMVDACMTPLIRVVAVNETATVGVAAEIAVRTNHSRLPVYRGRIDNVIGLVHQADLLFAPDDNAPLADLVRPVPFIPEAKRADELFQEMRDQREHFAVAVDEYGGCVGIVSLEDLLELFVGDIADEREVVQPTILRIDDHSWSVPGNTELDDILMATGLALPEGDYETVAGLVLSQLGKIPAPGEEVILDGARLRVTEATDRAVRRLDLISLAEPDT